MRSAACCSTYLVAGFFGAAMYGDQTNSNALVNEWLPGVGTVILNLVSWQLSWLAIWIGAPLICEPPRCCSGCPLPACQRAAQLAAAADAGLGQLAGQAGVIQLGGPLPSDCSCTALPVCSSSLPT